MPFLAAIPAVLSSLGVGGAAMGTAATIGSALAGAAGLASGIIQKDPLGAATSAIGGALGGLGGMGGVGGGAGTSAGASSAAPIGATTGQAVSPLSQSIGAAAPAATQSVTYQAPDLLKALSMPAPDPGDFFSAVKGLEAPAQGMSLGNKVGKGLELANALGSTAAGIYGALRDTSGSSGPIGLPGIDSNLPPAVGANAGQLPGIELSQIDTPEMDYGFKPNKTLLELLGAFQV